jgi:deoxycytidylate deaminase
MGCSLLVSEMFPCTNCAKQIIQAGIKTVYAPFMQAHHSQVWHDEEKWSSLMFQEAGVEVVRY